MRLMPLIAICALSFNLPAFTQAGTYVFNGKDAPTADEIKLSSSDRSAWLQNFSKQIDVQVANTKDRILASDGESLSQVIQSASEQFLQGDYTRAEQNVSQALEILARTLPYPSMSDDLKEIAALDITIQASLDSSLDQPSIAAGFARSSDFLDRLPYRVRTKLEAQKQMHAVSLAAVAPKATRWFLNGQAQSASLQLGSGKYMVHIVQQDEIQMGFLNVSNTGEPLFEKKYSRSIFSLPIEKIRPALLNARPKHLPAGSVTLYVTNDKSVAIPILLNAPTSSSAAPQEKSKPATTNQADWMKELEADLKESPKDESASLFQNPWFWAGVGVLAGVGGYLIYDATSGQKTVTTP